MVTFWKMFITFYRYSFCNQTTIIRLINLKTQESMCTFIRNINSIRWVFCILLTLLAMMHKHTDFINSNATLFTIFAQKSFEHLLKFKVRSFLAEHCFWNENFSHRIYTMSGWSTVYWTVPSTLFRSIENQRKHSARRLLLPEQTIKTIHDMKYQKNYSQNKNTCRSLFAVCLGVNGNSSQGMMCFLVFLLIFFVKEKMCSYIVVCVSHIYRLIM